MLSEKKTQVGETDPSGSDNSQHEDKQKQGVEKLMNDVDKQRDIIQRRKSVFDRWLDDSTHFISEVSGLADGARNVAQTYVNLMFATADTLQALRDSMRDSVLNQIGETFPATKYYQQVKELSDRMAKSRLDDKPVTDESFWLSAEHHFYSVIDGILETNKSTSGALRTLAVTLDVFSSESHLARIRKRAFEVWQTSSKVHSPLDYWLIAEKEILEVIRTTGTMRGTE